jgi:outer membrane protein assembly factor BamD (BamD/ComL family)
MKVHYRFPALITLVLLSGCSAMTGRSDPPVADAARRAALFDHIQALVSQGQYDAAYNENQKILQEGRGDPDVALFNMGMISAHLANPQKNYARALSSFRKLVKEYPHSQMVEPAKTWIQVLEEYHRVAEEKRVLTDEKHVLIEEKRVLTEEKRVLVRERESLVREKQKLKYTTEKSRQVDMEIEKRRREMLLRK